MKKLLILTLTIILLTGCEKNKEPETFGCSNFELNGKTYDMLRDTTQEDFKEYLLVPSQIFTSTNYTKFKANDYALFIAHKFLIDDQQTNEAEINKAIYQYFNEKEFRLLPGTYTNIDGSKFTIYKNDEIYTSNLKSNANKQNQNTFKEALVNGNNIAVSYDYGTKSETVGKTTIQLVCESNKVSILKIVYEGA